MQSTKNGKSQSPTKNGKISPDFNKGASPYRDNGMLIMPKPIPNSIRGNNVRIPDGR